MGQMLIRNLDDRVIVGLKSRAARNRTSAEEEARRVLAASVGIDRAAALAEAAALRARGGRQDGPSSTDLLRADRDRDAGS